MDFSNALRNMKEGKAVYREGWNDKGMWLYHVPASKYPAQTEVAKRNIGNTVPYSEYIAMKTSQDAVAPWLASQSDMLADDWMLADAWMLFDEEVKRDYSRCLDCLYYTFEGSQAPCNTCKYVGNGTIDGYSSSEEPQANQQETEFFLITSFTSF